MLKKKVQLSSYRLVNKYMFILSALPLRPLVLHYPHILAFEVTARTLYISVLCHRLAEAHRTALAVCFDGLVSTSLPPGR